MAEFSYRQELLQFAAEQYGTEPAYLWAKYPRYAALRHNDKKWYALIMDVPKEKLRLPGTGIVDIINLKVEPLLAGSLRMEKGFFPAYHMNRENWTSVLLDGTVDLAQIKDLLGLSYDLTKAKSKRKGKHKMAKKIVVLSTSFRKEGNSAQLARQFAKGAQDAGHEVKEIYLSDYHMENCRGCFACQKTGKCVVQDNVGGILEEMRSADVLAFATPVYFYGMCGAMKTFLDRTYPLFPDKYEFRDIYLLAAAGEDLETTIQGAVEGLDGWIRCFEKTRLAKVIFAGGVMESGEINGHPALQEAYQAGKQV